MDKLPPDVLRSLQIVAAGLMAGVVFFFGAVALVKSLGGGPSADIPYLPYVALGLALAAPLGAAALRHNLSAGFAGEAQPLDKRRAAVIAPLAILEGAAMLCAVAFLLTPSYIPAAAAVVPLATMALFFPRG